jgi:hypothetical protein
MDSSRLVEFEEAMAALGVRAGALAAAQRRTLDEQGYLVLPGAVATKDLERLRSAFDRACDLEGIPPRGTRHPTRLIDGDAAFVGFLIFPALLAAVQHVLGRPFLAGAVAGRDPMPGFGQQGLHTDGIDPGPSTPFQIVTALGLLDDFTQDNGATRLVPGSHRWRRPPPKSLTVPASRHPDQVVMTAPAGSVLVFNGYLWHSGTCNRSGDHRRVTQCSFVGREQRRPGATQPLQLDLPPATCFLLGFDPGGSPRPTGVGPASDHR